MSDTSTDLESQVANLSLQVEAMADIVAKQVAMLTLIEREIAPVLSKLEGNPMFRMMFGGNK